MGNSFFQQNSGQRPTGFVSASYRFKPASVDQSNTGHIKFDGNSVHVQFDKDRINSNNANKNAANMKSNYTGKSSMATNREFFYGLMQIRKNGIRKMWSSGQTFKYHKRSCPI